MTTIIGVSVAEFEDLLSSAEENAVSGYEMDFVADIRDKYEKYKENIYLSYRQEAMLRRIDAGCRARS